MFSSRKLFRNYIRGLKKISNVDEEKMWLLKYTVTNTVGIIKYYNIIGAW